MSAIRDTWRMERVRLTTVRSSYLLLAAIVGIAVLVALLIALLNPARELSPGATAAALTAGAPFLPLPPIGALLGVLGVLVVSHDYRYGLIRAVFATQPRRSVLFGTRLGLLGLLGALVASGVGLLTAGLCWVVGRTPAHDPTTLRLVGSHVVLAMAWTWLGAGLAWLMRVSTGPLAVLFVTPLLVEPVLTAVAQLDQLSVLRPLVRVLPFTAGRELLSFETARSADAVGAVLGGLLFATYLTILLTGSWLALTRRDA